MRTGYTFLLCAARARGRRRCWGPRKWWRTRISTSFEVYSSHFQRSGAIGFWRGLEAGMVEEPEVTVAGVGARRGTERESSRRRRGLRILGRVAFDRLDVGMSERVPRCEGD